MDLSIIIVSYNQLRLLKRCINSIYKWTKSIKFEVIVVDNDSKEVGIDSYLDSSSKSRDDFKFIKNRANHGFAAANNTGYRNSSGDFVVFLNPDTVLLNNSLKIMYDLLRENKDIAICGPRILYPDKSFQVSFYSFPTLTKKFLKVMGVNKILAKSPNFLKGLLRFKRLIPEYASMFNANFQEIGRPMEVPWVTGACLMIRE
ncbi:MAG: glycosyltransferase, partial [Actinomycetia bacterium]|nr:glycosyltransferase [Actinomycetes bacterium]